MYKSFHLRITTPPASLKIIINIDSPVFFHPSLSLLWYKGNSVDFSPLEFSNDPGSESSTKFYDVNVFSVFFRCLICRHSFMLQQKSPVLIVSFLFFLLWFRSSNNFLQLFQLHGWPLHSKLPLWKQKNKSSEFWIRSWVGVSRTGVRDKN